MEHALVHSNIYTLTKELLDVSARAEEDLRKAREGTQEGNQPAIEHLTMLGAFDGGIHEL